MAESFNEADQSQNKEAPQEQGTSFSQDQGKQGETQLSADQIAALQQRDTHAQDHIKVLENENEKFRQEMTRLTEKVDKLGDVDSIMEKLNRADVEGVDEASLIEKARAGVLTSLAEDRANKSQDDNFKSVQNALTAQYGEKTDEAVQRSCDEHGMSFEDMVALAKSNPKAALSLCKADTKMAPQPTSPSSINTLGLTQTQPSADTNVGTGYLELSEADRVKHFMDRMAKV